MIMPVTACAMLLSATLSASAAPATLRLQTDVSYTANLVHWVDNLAGTSVGKTLPVYRSAWSARFGPLDQRDRQALQEFVRLRMAPIPSGAEVMNRSGCLPVESDVLSWHQKFLAAAMQASSVQELSALLSSPLSTQDAEKLGAVLRHFEPRFRQIWEGLEHVRSFQGRFESFLREGGLPAYLDTLAGFFGVNPADTPPMKVSFIGLPADGPTHAEADGDHLLVEIRPNDRPEHQIQVVAHEASHFLMRRLSAQRVDALAAEAHGQGAAGALIWRYMWEGIPTTLGQGLAEAKLTPATFSTSLKWYHIGTVDRFAKLIYPSVSRAVLDGGTLDGPLMRRLARVVEGSSLFTEATPAEFLMSSFFAAGKDLGAAAEVLQSRMGSGSPPAERFSLEDPRLADLMQRYACLGGVAIVTADELPRLAGLDGGLSLSGRSLRAARDHAARGDGTILTGRRTAGGTVFVLVAPDAGRAAPLLDSFIHMKGLPSSPVDVPIAGARRD
ncbi:MAG: hypothetical protein ACREAA_16475 [Candidatus Polarisedimenticolia bacterium]